MIYIVDSIGEVVQSMRLAGHLDPYYMYGHRVEINNRLTEMDQDKVFKYQKYPLIALRMDIPEVQTNGVWHFDLNVAIMTMTEKDLNAQERMTQVFKPILYPLYQNFIQKMQSCGLFFWPNQLENEYPPHTKIDRPFWGVTGAGNEGNVKNIFSDPLDAIELVNLKINSRQRFNCS